MKDQQGRRTERREEGKGAGDMTQNEDSGLKSLKSFFHFCGSADVKEIRIQSFHNA